MLERLHNEIVWIYVFMSSMFVYIDVLARMRKTPSPRIISLKSSALSFFVAILSIILTGWCWGLAIHIIVTYFLIKKVTKS